ncbi:hypothetical protein WICPIJ_002983, partial [Wickerhamomyces pijperi]
TSSAINLITSMDSHRPSLQNSPLNLTSSLSNLSFSNNKDTQPQQHQHHHHHPQQHQTQPQQQQPLQQPSPLHQQPLQQIQNLQRHSPTDQQQSSQLYTVQLRNLPSDITLREAYCIFAFAKDFVNLDIVPDSANQPVIFARFRSLSSASSHSSILENHNVFGPGYPYLIQADVMESNVNFATQNTNASTTALNGLSQQSHQQQQQQQQPPFNLSKRPSIGNHRSR